MKSILKGIFIALIALIVFSCGEKEGKIQEKREETLFLFLWLTFKSQ